MVRPQLWSSPALTDRKLSAGGVDCRRRSLPQQTTVPSNLTPQVCSKPASMEENTPDGGDVVRTILRSADVEGGLACVEAIARDGDRLLAVDACRGRAFSLRSEVR